MEKFFDNFWDNVPINPNSLFCDPNNYFSIHYDIYENLDKMYSFPVFKKGDYRHYIIDSSRLYDYLSKEFIPSHLHLKYKNINSNDDSISKNTYKSIYLNDLLKLQLSEKEMQMAMDYIDKKGIIIEDDFQNLTGRYNCHDYLNTYRKLTSEDKNDLNSKKEEYVEYYKTKDPKLRKKLIEDNIELVQYATWYIAYYYDIDREELDSYSFEVLANSLDNYDPASEYTFSTYAIREIKRFVISKIPKIKGYDNWDDFKTFVAFIKLVDIYEKTDPSHLKYYDSRDVFIFAAVELDVLEEKIINVARKYSKNGSLDFLLKTHDIESNLESEDSLITGIEFVELLDSALQGINDLDELDRQVIGLKTGIIGGKAMSNKEIADTLNISKSAVTYRYKKALRKVTKKTFGTAIPFSYFRKGTERYNEIISDFDTLERFIGYNKTDDSYSDIHNTTKK